MKILYGVQGTGNGHLSRARAMAKAFEQHPELEITWLFSGRSKSAYFDMDAFGSFACHEGLTFFTQGGQVNILQTLLMNKPLRFIQDFQQLDLCPYDLIISDYEPITAWALKKSDKPSIGIGHQYAFDYPIPTKGNNLISRTIMRQFAPMPRALGLHWFHFGQPLLPPIVDIQHCTPGRTIHNKVLVYLPFENTQTLLSLFRKFPTFEFYTYAPGVTDYDQGNCHVRAFSQKGFKKDLIEANWVLCNSGFELISEALQLGKRIMSKPLKGQMEQLSNSTALEKLGLATVEANIDQRCLDFWFSCEPDPVHIKYPDVATAIAAWIHNGCEQSVESLSESLWKQTLGFDPDYSQDNHSYAHPFL